MGKTRKAIDKADLRSTQDAKLTSKIDSSSHSIDLVCLKDEPDSKFFFKTYSQEFLAQGPANSSGKSCFGLWGTSTKAESPTDTAKEQRNIELAGQLEAFYSALYRILLGEGAAETYAVFEDGKCIGTASKVITGFTSAKQQSIEIHKHKAGLARMIAASYALEEDDLHKGNYGIDKKGRIVRLDFDMSGWSRTYKVKGKRTVSQAGFLRTPRTRFEITERDVKSLPELHDANPFYWPTSLFYYFDDSQDFRNLQDDFEFNQHKYFTLLMFCLIPEAYIRKLAKWYIEPKFSDDRDLHVKGLIERQKNLRNTMLRMPGFQCFALNKGVFKQDPHSAHKKYRANALSQDNGKSRAELVDAAFAEHKEKAPLFLDMQEAFSQYNELFSKSSSSPEEEVINFDKEVKNNLESIIDSAQAEYDPDNEFFSCKTYARFNVPDAQRALYDDRKKKVRKELVKRLEYLRKANQVADSYSSYIFSPTEKAKNLYDHYIRGVNVKKLKIAWLEEVIDNSKDPNRVITDWFDTKRTPRNLVRTGETWRLINTILDSESAYAIRLMKLKDHADGNVKLGNDLDIVLNDNFTELCLDGDLGKDMKNYIEKLKHVLGNMAQEKIKHYEKPAGWLDFNSGVREHKLAYFRRIHRKLPKAKNIADIFHVLKFRDDEIEHANEIKQGTDTKDFIKFCHQLENTLPDSIITERNHFIIWLKRFIKDHCLESGHTHAWGAGYFAQSGNTNRAQYNALTEAMNMLKTNTHSIKSVIKKLRLAQIDHPDLKKMLNHFEGTAKYTVKPEAEKAKDDSVQASSSCFDISL